VNPLFRHPRRYLVAHWMVTLALAFALLSPQFGQAPRSHAVTLLTGQVVTLDASGQPEPQPGLDEFTSSAYGSVAVPIAAEQQLGVFFDARLFEPGYLEQQGYGDDSSNSIPLIVSFGDHDEAVAAQARGVIEGSIHITHVFEYVPFASGYVNKSGPFVPATAHGSLGVDGSAISHYSSWWQSVTAPDTVDPIGDAQGVNGLFLDDRVVLPASDSSTANIGPSLDSALKIIGADVAHQRGLMGTGVRIAVVDTGIDSNHPDLAGRVIAAKNFSTDRDTIDHFGHGTHVASIAAGTGAASDGKYEGVAPGALLINAKALNSGGGGTIGGIMQAMEWAADQGAKVINMSLGAGQSDGKDALSLEVDAISQQKGVLFAIAAGNAGTSQKVSTPAAADMSLAVGAIDKSSTLAWFSSRGPRYRDMALKPDVVAPGVDIMAARANPGSGDPYISHSGTSMAAPMAAGSAALVWQLHPDWTGQQVKDALMSSATPIGETCQVSAFDQGDGVVSLANIVNQAAIMDPGSVSFGLVSKGMAKQTARITNISDHPLSLTPQAALCPSKSSAAQVVVTPAQVELGPGASLDFTVTVSGLSNSGAVTGELNWLASGTLVASSAIGLVVK